MNGDIFRDIGAQNLELKIFPQALNDTLSRSQKYICKLHLKPSWVTWQSVKIH